MAQVWTAAQVTAYLDGTGASSTKLGMDGMAQLLQQLGQPHKDMDYVHIAGTNGKGSVSAMTAQILQQAGYRVGLFTSPALHSGTERIRVDGQPIDLAKLGELLPPVAEAVQRLVRQGLPQPAEFELWTALAFCCFAQAQCQIVVLEAGIGGRWDCTNLIASPQVAVLTSVGLDHTPLLGRDLGQIARDKAGIVKPGCHCVSARQSVPVMEQLQAVCSQQQVPLQVAAAIPVESAQGTLDGWRFGWQGQQLRLPLLGEHQLQNCAVALEVVQTLRCRGWQIGDEAVAEGLERVRWPARLERLCSQPEVILDGAHNPAGIGALSQAVAGYYGGRRLHLVIGVLADKAVEELVQQLGIDAATVTAVQPPGARGMAAEQLAELLRQGPYPQAKAAETVEQGLAAALGHTGPGEVLCVFGSLHLAPAVREYFGKNSVLE